MYEWLKKFGKIGGAISSALQILFLIPGLTVSALLAFGLAVWVGAVQWVQQPTVYVPFCAFILFLWTWIGLKFLFDRNKPITIRPQFDYEYALIPEQWSCFFAKFASNDLINPNADAINLSCNFRNVSSGPMKISIEEFRVILDGQTCNDPDVSPEIVLPRMSPKSIIAGAVKRDITRTNYAGNASIRLLYGPPNGPYVREYILKQAIQITLNDDRTGILMTNTITSEKDLPYEAR